MKLSKYIIALSLITGGLVSCRKDLLNVTPATAVQADASAFSTTARVYAQLLSLYGTLKSGNFYGGRYVVYGDIRGEEFLNETSNLVTASDVWSMNLANSATSVKTLWSQGYLTINACNVFLDGMAATGTAVVGDSLSKNYIAEAKFIRALSYYSLLQYYSMPYAYNSTAGNSPGLPLRLQGNTVPGNYDLKRSTVAEVYAQVIKDLDSAESLLPLKYSTAYTNTTRVHRNSAIALKTRVYLSMQKYDNVITEANKIVSAAAPFTAATGYSNTLQSDITAVFKTPYTTTESILSMPMTSTAGDYPGTQNSLCSYFYMSSSTPGSTEYTLNLATGSILADVAFKTADKRRNLIFTNSAGTKKFVAKYTAASPYTDYVPIMRYSEVLLNLAEARARSTNSVDAQAVALLNAVHGRSDAATVYVPASVDELINTILTERRIEFLGEGLRNNDLMRLVQNIPAKGSAPGKVPGADGYIWPISSEELSLNKLINQ